jgi:hypothetical protein
VTLARAPMKFPASLALVLLAVFLCVDGFFVRARTRTLHEREAKRRAVEEMVYRARSEGLRLQVLESALGRSASGAGDRAHLLAIDYLNGLLKAHSLRKLELGAGSARDARGEPFHITVRGRYPDLVLFLRDLESTREAVRLREIRISKLEAESDLEMRVRLEIERAGS